MLRSGWEIALTAAFVLAAAAAAAESGLRADMLEIRGVTHEGDEIRGDVVNVSGDTVRDVQLRILANWLWTDDLHPGTDDQSWGVVITLPGPIAPGEAVPFTARRPSPAPARSDGYFEVEVRVAGVARTREVPEPDP